MRTIKFRGKDIKTGKWVIGDLHLLCDKPHIHTAKSSYPFAGQRSFVVPETIGQFIGLRDKKGTEIYEGDIIYSEFSDGSHTRCLVGWNDEETCFGIMDEYAYRSKLQGYDFPEFDSRLLSVFRKDGKIFEVIGNIHDNPELLKQ